MLNPNSTMKICTLIYLTGIVIISCNPNSRNIKPTYNKGGFTITHFQTEPRNGAEIFGQVKDFETNEIIRSAIIKLGCLTVQSDETGTYRVSNGLNSGESFLTCSLIGYRTIETERFKSEKGDSLKIDFFLVQDDRPLINCEGQE